MAAVVAKRKICGIVEPTLFIVLFYEDKFRIEYNFRVCVGVIIQTGRRSKLNQKLLTELSSLGAFVH